MKYLNVRLIALAGICCWLLTCVDVRAQHVSDYIHIGASSGYSTLIGQTSDMSVPGNVNGGFHFGYEVRRTNFIYGPFLSLQYFSSRCNTNVAVEDVPIKDTRLGDAILHYNMNSPLMETQQFLIPSVGIVFGWSGNNYNKNRLNGAFYFLAGVQLSMKYDIQNNVGLIYSTSATYERYIDDYEDMPNHYYRDQNVSATDSFGVKWGGMATAELGWELNLDHYDKLKVGLFVNVGFNNIMSGVETKPIAPNPDNVEKIMLYSYYRSPEMEGKYVVPLMTGFKISYAFNVNIKRECVSKDCRIGYRKKHSNRRRRR